MPDTNQILNQVLEASQKSAVQQEIVLSKVSDLVIRMDAQDSAIKELRTAIQGSSEQAGLLTRLALIEATQGRLEASMKELEKSDAAQRDDLKEITTRYKTITALLGLASGGGGAGIAIALGKIFS